MANEEHLKILRQGVEVWYQWREENPDIRPDLSLADLSGANLHGANLIQADLREADLRGAELSEANLSEADLSETVSNEGYVNRVNLSRADLSRADLSRANLRGAELSEANLSEADLSRTDLSGANLRGADLSEADLNDADLANANLNDALLIKAGLMGADLWHSVLKGADLRGASLYAAILNNTYLREANLSGAEAGHTSFDDLDLSVVKGLETIQHRAPSTIGFDTIYHSGGKIPEAFLRGCGLSDLQIEMAKLHNPDLTSDQITDITYKMHELYIANPIQYYSCFISYSHQDEAFAECLHNDLQGKGVRCWFAPEHMKGGRKLYPQIDEAIRAHDKLLLVLSENSIHSEWVMTEIRRARKAEARDRRRKLFPVRLVDWGAIKTWECFDADTGKDLAVEVREYFIPDFSHWKDHDAYQEGFDRLLRDLKAEEG